MEPWQVEIVKIVVARTKQPRTCAEEVIALVEQLKVEWEQAERAQWQGRPGPRLLRFESEDGKAGTV